MERMGEKVVKIPSLSRYHKLPHIEKSGTKLRLTNLERMEKRS